MLYYIILYYIILYGLGLAPRGVDRQTSRAQTCMYACMIPIYIYIYDREREILYL